jgi:hypothetical protein
MEFNSDFRHDLKLAQETENAFAEVLGPNTTIEIKDDLQASKTGNIFIEFESRGKKSGISTTEADYWTIHINGVWITLNTDKLKDIARKAYQERGPIKGGDSNTSKGVLIKIKELI